MFHLNVMYSYWSANSIVTDFDFDAFNHDTPYEGEDGQVHTPAADADAAPVTASTATEIVEEKLETPVADNTDTETTTPVDNGHSEEVDKWWSNQNQT